MLEECIASQSEVIRAIVSDNCPCHWGPAPCFGEDGVRVLAAALEVHHVVDLGSNTC